ncbi:MAG: type II secretion system F family protein [Ignisphaera sp.]|nr:type II secretion system F family protein [Ignisphaera sp.]
MLVASALLIPLPLVQRLALLVSAPIPLVVQYSINLIRRRGLEAVVDEDLLYLITHMYAVATGKPPHERLFMLGGVSGKGYGKYTRYLNRISTIAKQWGYGFVRATRIVASKITNTIFRDFLYRLAEAINVGEDLEIFLQMEQSTMLTTYEADYTRVLEALKLVLGIYTASISSAIFINVNLVLIAFLLGNPLLPVIAFVATIGSLIALLLLIKKLLPKQRLVHDLKINMPEIRLYRYTLILSLAIATALSIYTFTLFNEPSYTLTVFGLTMLIPGIIGRRIERKVKEVESFFIIFIRSLGLVFSMIRNYTQAIRSILASELGILTKYLRNLYARLLNGIDPKVAMYYFVGESGSEIVRRGIDIFYDAVEAGGDPVKVGESLSITIQRVINLRKQREQVARAFQGVIYILTLLTVALAEFVFTLVILLQQVFAALGAGAPIQILPTTFISPLLLSLLKLGLVFAITIMNAFALELARGGFIGAAWFHGGILLILSGVTMIVSSMFSKMILATLQIPQVQLP